MANVDVVRIKQYAENAALIASNPGADPFIKIIDMVVADGSGVAVDDSGNVYIADKGRHCIWKIKEGLAPYVYAGANGTSGDVTGAAETARFNAPADLAMDASGNLFVYDSGNKKIKKIASNGSVSVISTLTTGTLSSLTVAPNGIIYAAVK